MAATEPFSQLGGLLARQEMMMSRIEVVALIASAVVPAGVIWMAACLTRRLLRCRRRAVPT